MPGSLADELKRLRAASGLSLAKFGALFGVSKGYVWQVETGLRKSISYDFAAKLVSGLSLTPGHFDAILAPGVVAPPPPSLRVVSFTPEADYEGDSDLPFAGKVSCGPPGPGTTCDGTTMAVPAEFDGPGRYILEAEGMSMIDFGITPGTFIVIMPSEGAENGQDVLAQIDGEFTLKRFVVRGRGDKREMLLMGSGDAKPIRIREGEYVRILGVVKHSFRTHK